MNKTICDDDLRDQFAMAALTGLLSHSSRFSPGTITDYADDAYVLANEMLLAKDRVPYEPKKDG
ncbi:MAG: hypothetical protein ACW987_20140 [Candidatus Thorarchaeota archaeon]